MGQIWACHPMLGGDSGLERLGTGGAYSNLPGQTYSLGQIANQLVTGYWADSKMPWSRTGDRTISFDVQSGGTLTVNLSGLTAQGQKLARWALEAWHDATGITFSETSFAGADIVFQDDDAGAYAGPENFTGNRIEQSVVNIGTDWLSAYGTTLDSYALLSYIHEIGHALGLGHAGNYNGDGTYAWDRLYDNDTWQLSIMSYFSAKNIGATDAYPVTPMAADLAAVTRLYGAAHTTRTGDTTYGIGGNVGGYLEQVLSVVTGVAASDPSRSSGQTVSFTLVDHGGHNRINFSNDTRAQKVDLHDGAASDIYGNRGTMVIAPGTVIHDYDAGSGADRVIGNESSNYLRGNGGNDSLSGLAGNDRLAGGAGSDLLNGGAGYDIAEFGPSGGAIRADLSTGRATGQGTDQLQEIEGLRTAGGADQLRGDGGANTLIGAGGADSLYGAGGGDRLIGGARGDLLNGGAGDDQLFGSLATLLSPAQLGPVSQARVALAGASSAGSMTADVFAPAVAGQAAEGDRIWGGAGDDRLFGSAADDRLIAGLGKDLITGGAGRDSFIFRSAAEMGEPGAEDRILDFQSGHDVIDLSALHLNSLHRGGLTGRVGEVSFLPGAGRIEVDLDGDGRADAVLIVIGDTLAQGDILI